MQYAVLQYYYRSKIAHAVIPYISIIKYLGHHISNFYDKSGKHFMLEETFTGHYTTPNIVSILGVHKTPHFMFAYRRILLYYYIGCHYATQCVTVH